MRTHWFVKCSSMLENVNFLTAIPHFFIFQCIWRCECPVLFNDKNSFFVTGKVHQEYKVEVNDSSSKKNQMIADAANGVA